MKHWLQALRPLAQVNIAVPLILGQVAAWYVTARFSWLWFGVALTWGVLDHAFVVLSNDYADREADTGNRTLFSGGSGVIAEGKLTGSEVGRAAAVAAIVLLLYSCTLSILGRAWVPIYGLAALLLMWLYSFAPVKLSYRGGGEVLQGIGVGIGLPSLGYYLQAEAPFAPMWIMGPALVLGVSGNVLTALPDVDDDRKAGKKTWPVRHGVASARRFASAGIAFAAFGVFLWTPWVSLPARATVAILPALPLLIGARAHDPFRAAWWSSVALNALIGLWMLAMLLKL
jgi:1,4-dihydroxy-2-naphthoate octaprenyltransferase